MTEEFKKSKNKITSNMLSQFKNMLCSDNIENFNLAVDILHKRDRDDVDSESNFYSLINNIDKSVQQKTLSELLKKSIDAL